jgi:hypothetical protein
LAENPLLPNRRLQELHALMLHCRDLDKKYRLFSGISREAVLAAAAVQMEPGDFLCGGVNDRSVTELSQQKRRLTGRRTRRVQTIELSPIAPAGLELAFSAGVARAFKNSGKKDTVVVLSSADASPERWRETLSFAQHAKLPYVVIYLDYAAKSRSSRKQDTLDLGAITELSKKSYLPVLTVDGDDAVAMYRVMQEALLRARMQDGPSLVWCTLENRAKSRTSKPIAHMEQYLASRNLKTLRA